MASSSSSSSRSSSSILRRTNIKIDYPRPVKYCRCIMGGRRLKAARWTSWIDENPGRRFYGYRNYKQVASCGFFEWHDEEMGDRTRMVINELKIKKKMLIESNKNLSACLERPIMYASSEVRAEISNLWDDLCKLKATKH